MLSLDDSVIVLTLKLGFGVQRPILRAVHVILHDTGRQIGKKRSVSRRVGLFMHQLLM